MLQSIIERSHHYAYAFFGAAALITIAYFFAPHHSPVEGGVAIAPSVPAAGSLQREFEAGLLAGKALAAAQGGVPIYQQPAVTVLKDVSGGGFSGAAIAQYLAALGRPLTAPTYHVSLVAPTPMPAASLPPSVTQPYADWMYTTAYNADSSAIANAKLNIHVTQDPIPPSRIQTLYLSDKSAGVSYAVKRRGQMDLDLGITQGAKGTEVFAGPCLHIKDTSAGVCAGATLNQKHIGAAIGLTISF